MVLGVDGEYSGIGWVDDTWWDKQAFGYETVKVDELAVGSVASLELDIGHSIRRDDSVLTTGSVYSWVFERDGRAIRECDPSFPEVEHQTKGLHRVDAEEDGCGRCFGDDHGYR